MQRQTRLDPSTGITPTKSKPTTQLVYSVVSLGKYKITQRWTPSVCMHPKELNQDVRRRQVSQRIQEPRRGSAFVLHAEESGQQDHHWLERWQRQVAKRMTQMIFLVSNKSISIHHHQLPPAFSYPKSSYIHPLITLKRPLKMCNGWMTYCNAIDYQQRILSKW